MEEELKEYILYKETTNQADCDIMKDVLEQNEIRYKYVQRVTGFKYKTTYNQIYIHREDEDKAKECLEHGEFADIPWDPDSDDTNPEPDFPWYLDVQKKGKVGKVFGRILFGGVIIMCALAIYLSTR